jgi:hypothetical protein
LRAEADPQFAVALDGAHKAAILVRARRLDEAAFLQRSKDPVRGALRQTGAFHHVT